MTTTSSRRLATLAALTLLSSVALTTTTAHAQTTGFTLPGSHFTGQLDNCTVGYTFTVGASAISVTDLGFWDWNQDGLSSPYLISIWNGSGTLLGSGTVPAGTIATLDNRYRYVSLGGSPIALAANTTYTIGTYVGQEVSPTDVNAGAITPGTGVTLGAARLAVGNTFPTGDAFSAGHYMTPNFKFTPAGGGSVAPEPGTLVLLALGGGLILAKRRKK